MKLSRNFQSINQSLTVSKTTNIARCSAAEMHEVLLRLLEIKSTQMKQHRKSNGLNIWNTRNSNEIPVKSSIKISVRKQFKKFSISTRKTSQADEGHP